MNRTQGSTALPRIPYVPPWPVGRGPWPVQWRDDEVQQYGADVQCATAVRPPDRVFSRIYSTER